MSGPLTADQAIDLIYKSPGAYTTPEQIRALAARVNADAAGRLTLLYSGAVGEGVWSSDIIKGMVAAGEDVRVINKNEAAKFMESKDFISAVAKAHGIPAEALIAGTYRGAASDWLYHPTQGPWADASARFAESTKGEVRAIVSGAAPDRVFGATELPRVIANPQVSRIEDLPRQTLVKVQVKHGPQAAFEMTLARAHENVATLRLAVSAAGIPIKGDNGALLLDSRAYLQGTHAQAKASSISAPTRRMGELMGPPSAAARAGQVHLQTWLAQIELDVGVASQRPAVGQNGAALVRGSGVVGTVGLVAADAYITGRETARMLNEDNLTGAQSHIVHFGARNLGMAGGAALGSSAGVPLGAPGMVIGGIAGGVGGAVAGEKLADVADRARIYNQRGSDGHAWQSDPEHPELGWSRHAPAYGTDAQGKATYDMQTLQAGPRLASELDYKASSTAVELALAHAPNPKNPFSQPAGPGDAYAVDATPWTRDPATRQWSRYVADPVQAAMGNPTGSTEQASLQRSAQLDQAAQATIAHNVEQSRQGIAQQYQSVYDERGWKQHGPVPAAVLDAERALPTPQQAPAARANPAPTPGGMSFAEAHQRRDEPEKISPGSLQAVDKLPKPDRQHELTLLREIGIVNAKTEQESGKAQIPPTKTLASPEHRQEQALTPAVKEPAAHELTLAAQTMRSAQSEPIVPLGGAAAPVTLRWRWLMHRAPSRLHPHARWIRAMPFIPITVTSRRSTPPFHRTDAGMQSRAPTSLRRCWPTSRPIRWASGWMWSRSSPI